MLPNIPDAEDNYTSMETVHEKGIDVNFTIYASLNTCTIVFIF